MINQAVLHQLEEAVDAYEENWSADSRERILPLLESFDLSEDSVALTEMIRVDIELRYECAIEVSLKDYFAKFGHLLNDPELIRQIAFEDFRSRAARGQSLSVSRWEGLPGVRDEAWFQQLLWQRSSRQSIAPLPQSRLPGDLDSAFLSELESVGFRLVQPIGQGAFSRVYLARQNELADRFVVLKIVNQPLAEPQSMAMLQHTNIVPIYSFHRILSQSVICMPYAGSVTLADFLQGEPTTQSRGGESLVVTVRSRVSKTTVDQGSDCGDTSHQGLAADRNGHGGKRQDCRIPAADDSAVLKPLESIRSLGCHELAVWIFSRLAGGLAHSHARGVLHGDLKPGNVLIRNDGEPALLDFNLSQSIGRKTAKHVGGTLPYMAPETYRALMGQRVEASAASDIYSLGVMLFEFVTGRLPYPVPHSIADIDLEPAIQVRSRKPNWRDQDNVSPSLRSIINRCLADAPGKRYGSADELRQDLECQQQSIPLKHASEPRRIVVQKWVRRHPRAILGVTSAALLLLLIPAAFSAAAYRSQSIYMSALARFDAFAQQSASVLSTVMVDPQRHQQAGVLAALEPLEEFGILDGSGLDRFESSRLTDSQRQQQRQTMLRHVAQVAFAEADRLRADFAKGQLSGEQLQLLDRLVMAADEFSGPEESRACMFLHAQRAKLAGDAHSCELLRDRARAIRVESDTEAYLDAVRLMAERQWDDARELLTILADADDIPSNLRWTMLGRSQYNAAKYEDAKISFTQSIEHAPDASRLWFMRGLCYTKLYQYARGEADFSRAIELEPDFASAWLNRGICRMAQVPADQDVAVHEKAVAAFGDYDKALQRSPGNAHVLIMRSRAHQRAGRREQAEADFAEAMKAENQSASALLRRAQARRTSDPEGAIADLQSADELDPGARTVLSQMARIYIVRLKQPQRAMQVLDRLLVTYPDHESALIDRAILYAYEQQWDKALQDLNKALQPPNLSRTLYQAACVRALFPERKDHMLALGLLARSIQAGYRADHLSTDPDLEAIRDMDGFRAIQRSYRLGHLGQPPRHSREDED